MIATEYCEYLTSIGWQMDRTREGFIEQHDDYRVEFDARGWELQRFTDGDIGDVAVGRFVAYQDANGDVFGEDLASLKLALNKLAARKRAKEE